jgi:hypothetical protein
MQHSIVVAKGCLLQGNWNVFYNLFLISDLSPTRTEKETETEFLQHHIRPSVANITLKRTDTFMVIFIHPPNQ